MATMSDNGVVTTSKNVMIPVENAGIGDAIAILKSGTGESKGDFIAIVGKSVEKDTLPNGYEWYGTVYGREKNGLMVRALVPTEAKWASTDADGVTVTLTDAHKSVTDNTSQSGGLMRNGTNAFWGYITAMSVSEVASRNANSTTTHLHPDSPYSNYGNYPMGKANFEADTNGAKTMYGTYENYIAQLLPIMKGSKSGVFSKRCGKANTKELALNNSKEGYSFPAAQYCYNYKVSNEGANHWWLPDTYELAVMMGDNSFEACRYAHSVLGGNTARAAYRWSCVRRGATSAWYYAYHGFSNGDNFRYGFTVVPVTLLPL